MHNEFSYDSRYLNKINRCCKRWAKKEIEYNSFMEIIMPNHWFCNCDKGFTLKREDYCFISTGGYMLGQLSNKSDRLNEFKKKAPRCYQKIILQKKLILRGKMRPIILSEGFPGWSASSFGIRIKEKDLFLLDGFHRALAFTLLKKKPRTISCVVAIM